MNIKLIRKVGDFHEYHYRINDRYYYKYNIRFNMLNIYIKNMPDILFYYYEYYTYI